MHLEVDAALSLLDLEGALVTPGVVPGVDAEPVVHAVFSAPTDGLDGVTTESRAALVSVDTGLVCQEVFVDGEGRGDGTVLLDLSLDVLNTADSIAAGREVLVVVVSASVVIDASLRASRGHLRDVVT